jgi:hypothetical protein
MAKSWKAKRKTSAVADRNQNSDRLKHELKFFPSKNKRHQQFAQRRTTRREESLKQGSHEEGKQQLNDLAP